MRNKFNNGGFVFIESIVSIAVRLIVLLISILALMPLTPLQAVERQVLHGSVPRAAAESRVMGAVDRSERINYSIVMPLRNQAELAGLKKDLYDPKSPQFHQFLSSEEFARRFGPTQDDYQKVIDHAQANGMTVTGIHPNRTILEVSGAAPDVEKMLNVNMIHYNHKDRGDYRAPDRDPSVDIGVPLLGISGLDNFVVPRPSAVPMSPLTKKAPRLATRMVREPPAKAQAVMFASGSGPNGNFIGNDFRKAYAPDVQGTGKGQTIGLVEFDGFYPADIQKYFETAGLPLIPVETVLLDGSDGSAGKNNLEVALDIDMAGSMANGVNVIVYEGNSGLTILNTMATENRAAQLSASWINWAGGALLDQVFLQCYVQGQTVLQASGDDGAYTGDIPAPNDNPDTTVVGGTSLTASATGAWQGETAWTNSSGGVSTLYSVPDYQQGIANANNGASSTMRSIPDVSAEAVQEVWVSYDNGSSGASGGTSAATPLWAAFIALVNEQAAANGKPRVGFVNPALYAIAKSANYESDFHDVITGDNGAFHAAKGYDLVTGLGSPTGQHLIDDLIGMNSPPFELVASPPSVTIGAGNSGFSIFTVILKSGFNGNVSLTATGVPPGVTTSFSQASITNRSASTLSFAVSSSATPGTYPIAIQGTSLWASPGTSPGTPGTASYTANVSLTIGGPQGTFVLTPSPGTFNIAAGSNIKSTITISPLNGFNSSVKLAAAGLPAGVTASFNPASVPPATPVSTTTLTLAVSNSATPGTYNIMVQGTPTTDYPAYIALTISAPSFELGASPANVSATAGSSGSSTITITPKFGFKSSVNLVALDLPAGVTATFSPASSSPGTTISTSKLSLAAASSAAPGTHTITVRGTSQGASPAATGTYSTHADVKFTIRAVNQ